MPMIRRKAGKPDRDRIDASEDYEVRDWAKKFGVSEEELRTEVQKASLMARDVAKQLGKSPLTCPVATPWRD